MARSVSLWLAVLMVAPIPLAAMPTAVATDTTTTTAHDICLFDPAAGSLKLILGPVASPTATLVFQDANGPGTACDTNQPSVASAAKNYTLSGQNTATPSSILKVGSTVTFEVKFHDVDRTRCGGGPGTTGAHPQTPTQTTDYRTTVHDLGTSALFGSSSLSSATGMPVGAVRVTTTVMADNTVVEPVAGVRPVSVLLTGFSICRTGTADTPGAPDKDWTVTLNNILVDNTPPKLDPKPLVVGRAINGTNGVAKIGDDFTYTVSVGDPDFTNAASKTVCEGYDFTVSPPTALFSTPGDLGLHDKFKTTGTACPSTASVRGPIVAKGTGTAGYDYDSTAVQINANAARLVSNIGVDDTTAPGTVPNLQTTVLDEYDNSGTAAVDGDSATAGTQLPKIDAVPPQAPATFTADTRPGATARVTIPSGKVSVDVVAFLVEKCFPTPSVPCAAGSGTWTTVNNAAGVSPVPRSWAAGSQIFDTAALTGTGTSSDVTLRVTAIDDAGNPSAPAYLLDGTGNTKVLVLDPTTPTFPAGTLKRGPTAESPSISPNEEHPFDVFYFDVSDNKMKLPSTTVGSTDPVYARLWRETFTSPGTRGPDEYWKPDGQWSTTPTNLEVRLVDHDAVSGGISRGKFKLDLNAINPCAGSATTCIPTGSYRLNFYATDLDSNTAAMFSPPCPSGTTQCDVGIPLSRDIKDPSYTFGAAKDYKNGNFNQIRALPDAPGGALDLTAVQQGQFLPVSLKVLDEGSGFKNITFRFMTGSDYGKVVDSTFGGPAIACMRTYNDTSNPSDTEALAIARIPAVASDCNIAPTPDALINAPPPFVVCYKTGSPQFTSCTYETTHCYGLNPTGTCSKDRTPYVNVSTDGVPFGTYKLQVSTTDWALRTKTLTLSEIFTIVPRVAIEPGSGVKKDGKISLVVYAGHSDDATAVSGATVPCEVRGTAAIGTAAGTSFTATNLPAGNVYFRVSAVKGTVEGPLSRAVGTGTTPLPALEPNPATAPANVEATRSGSSATVTWSAVAGATLYKVYRVLNTPTTLPSQTGVCEPVSVSIDYLPAGATQTEANYRNLKTFNAAVDKTVFTPDLGRQVYQPYGRRETAVGFYKFELKDFAPPSDVTLPEPPVLRVTVRATNVVNNVEGTVSSVRTSVTLSSTDIVSDLVPREPFTEWAATREPTFYRGAGTPDAGTQGQTRAADLVFKTGFNPAGILPKDTAVYYKIFDQGLNFTKQVTTPGITFDGGAGANSAPKLREGYHYFRVSAVMPAGEGPFSAARIVHVGGNGVAPPADTGEALPAGAPVITPAALVVAKDGVVSLTWPAVSGATAYRVYVGVDNAVYANTAAVPKTFSCDLAKPSNGERPCRLVYWADARSDAYDSKGVATGRNWIARVNVSLPPTTVPPSEWTLEDANNPEDPDHVVGASTGHAAHTREVSTATAKEVKLTRGLYIMEVTAHTKSGSVVNPRDVAYLARTFRVETTAPSVVLTRTTTASIDNREWTAGSPSFEVTYDVGHMTKTTAANVSVGVQLVESSGRSWVPAPTRVRQITLLPISVAAATTANLASLSGAPTIDGVTLVAGNRVLVKDQTNPSENGVYTVTTTGSWTRPTGARTLTDLSPGLLVTVDAGTVNGRTGWMLATSTSPTTGAVTADTTARTFTRYTTGADGVNLQRYNMTVDLGGYTHGTSFRLLLNLTGNNRTLVAPAFPNIREPRVLTLDLVGPTVKFDLEHRVVNGDKGSSNLVDGDVVFHGTVDDGIGSGTSYVQFAVREVDSGKWYDGSGFKATLEGQPNWLVIRTLSAGASSSEKVWEYVDADLAKDVEDEPDNYVLHARSVDKLGNRGQAVNATAVVDGRPPVLRGNATISPSGSDDAFTLRRFSIDATDRGAANSKEMAVNLHLLPPSGRLLTFPMKVSGSAVQCNFLSPATTQCWTLDLDEELGWVGDVEYYFSASDVAGNSFCSYGPCDSDPAKRPSLPSFRLEDNGPPEITSLKLDPAVPAAGGSVTAVAVIEEAANFLEGYPKAYFFRNGVEVANGEMHPLTADSVDPASGSGTWALSTLEAGISDLRENETLRIMVVARDSGDLASDPRSTSAVVSANTPPVLSILSPAAGATNYVGKTAAVKVRVDDVNADPRSFNASYVVENGSRVEDTLAANFTDVRPIVTLGKTLAWEFTYRGGDFPDGANVTLTFGARDNLSARGTVTLAARVDGAAPTVGASVEPKATSDAGTTYVGPLTTVTLDATDGVTPKEQIRVEYSVNGATVTSYTGPVVVTGGDTFSMTYAAIDLAGNRAEGTPISFAIDKTAPTVAVVASGANTTLTVTDDLVGVDDSRVRLFYKTSSTAAQFAEFPFDHATGNTYTATLGSVAGTFIYYVEAADKLGNVGHATVNGVTCTAETPCGLVDTGTEPPVITFVSPPEGQAISGATEVKWTAFASVPDPAIKLEAVNSAERILVKDGLALEGTTSLDPAALGLGAGDWVLVLTIDDRVNTPVTASRNVEVTASGTPEDVIGTPQTPPPTGPLTVGDAYTTKVPVNDTKVSKVKATIVRGNTVVRTVEFDVVDGAFDFRFSESSPGSYQVRLAPVYDDGTTGPAETFPGVFRVQGAGTEKPPAGGNIIQVSAIVIVGALVVALAAVGAFKRWK